MITDVYDSIYLVFSNYIVFKKLISLITYNNNVVICN